MSVLLSRIVPPRRLPTVFCRSCNKNNRVQLPDGRCKVCRQFPHLSPADRVCRGCGRQCAGARCSECAEKGDAA